MKTKVPLSILSVLFLCSQAFAQTSGGPDAYGYTWKNDADAAGPVYNWKNIKGTGTKITGLTDDNRTGPYNINWNFHSYWNDYNKFWVGSNGWISFQGTTLNIASPFLAIPSANSKNTICPLLSDLTCIDKNAAAVPGATAWYWSNNVDTVIVQYDSIPFWINSGPGYAGRNTFEVILSGVDTSITFQYKLYAAATPTYDITGEGLKTGIENSTGSIGLQVLNNTYPASNTAVKFYYPHPVTYQVKDVAPAWNQYSDDAGFFVSGPCGKLMHMKTDIANTGNQNVSGIPVTGQLLDANLNSVWNSSGSVSSLAAGADTALTFPGTYAANTPGEFTYRTITNLSSDINPGNDTKETEMVVADTTQATVGLSFTTATTTTTGLSWQGGNGGGGVYFIPPFYPATVVSIDYFVSGNAGNSGFSAELIDDNGPGNDPGTVLNSVSVANTAVIAPGYNTVMLTAPYTITSGGVYAAWIMNGDSIGLGTDPTFPLSNRNFELIGGSWASYRNNSAEDLMIRMNIQGSNSALVIATTSVPASCAGPGGNGSASATVSGGTPPYAYSWSNGQTTTTATGLSAGTHTVTVSDVSGCPRTATVTVTSPLPITTNLSSNPDACSTCTNGSAHVNASGGTIPYTYKWSPGGQTTATITGFPGTYTLCITDAKGCTKCDTISILNNTGINEIYAGASIVISPNPFSSTANVKIDLVNPVHQQLMFIVYDMFGREIKAIDMSTISTTGGTINFTLNRESISTGMYFYQFKDNEQVLSTGKLIVQ